MTNNFSKGRGRQKGNKQVDNIYGADNNNGDDDTSSDGVTVVRVAKV